MKKIDAILNREQEKYPALINKLSMILEPFALLATGNAPVYIGRIAEEMAVKECKECGAFIFSIEGNDLAHVDLKKMEASVFGGEHFSISTEDAQSVKNVLEALKHRDGSDNDIDPVRDIIDGSDNDIDLVRDIIDGMPKELKSLLGAAIAVSRLRKRGDN